MEPKPNNARTPTGQSKGRLTLVLGLTFAILAVEVAGGLWSGSLALLADAGHMLSDVAGLILAWVAITLAERPPTPEKTYGQQRFEILAALANAVALFGIAGAILFEAYRRFEHPPEVASTIMLIVAVVGLVANLLSMFLLHSHSGESLNLKAAYLEVLADMLGSVGVIVAALIMWATGWSYADPLISVLIAVAILPRAWSLVRDTVNVLLEGTPAEIDLEAVRRELSEVEGVSSVHDLHAWSLTTGVNALSAHVAMTDEALLDEVLTALHSRIRREFPITHATIQAEPPGFEGDRGELHE